VLETTGGSPVTDALRLSSTPGWNLAPGSDPLVPLAADWAAGGNYLPYPALAALGRQSDGGWSAVPLLFDVWGQTRFLAKPAEAVTPADWKSLTTKARAQSLAMAGGRPAFRQAAFLFQAWPNVAGEAEAAKWFVQAPQPWNDSLRSMDDLVNLPVWMVNSWRYSGPDLKNSYLPGTQLGFIETFRDFETANPPGNRRYLPLASEAAAGYALAGEVLFLELRGHPGQQAMAVEIIKALSTADFFKDAGGEQKWLAASQNAFELDPSGELVRRRVLGAARFFPVSDRLPEPWDETKLLVQIQVEVDRTPRKTGR
jgi:hypothetical protein